MLMLPTHAVNLSEGAVLRKNMLGRESTQVLPEKKNNHFFLHNLIAVVPYLVLVANGHITSHLKEEEREETWGIMFFGPTATSRRPRRRNRGGHFNVIESRRVQGWPEHCDVQITGVVQKLNQI